MAILLTVGCSGVEEVHCEDVKLPEKEQSTQELIDTFFGDYVVASLYPVLF